MTDQETQVSELREDRSIPPLAHDVTNGVVSFTAEPHINEELGLPTGLVDDWEKKAVAKLGELLEKNGALRVYLDSCVKCGACTDKCHYYIGTGDAKNMPAARQDLLRSVYRRYFTTAGKIAPDLVGARDLTTDLLDEWFTYFHQCSQCRRCSVFCPYGIDTAEISQAAREIMDTIGYSQHYCNEVIVKVHQTGNNLGLPEPALRDTLEGLEEDTVEDTGIEVKFPLDVKGADVLLVTPSADFFAEPHVDGMIGYAKVFHQAGISWTLSSYASEAGNFGLFTGSYEQMRKISIRIRRAARELGVKRIVIGECGHAWRVAYAFLNTFSGPWDFLDPKYPVPQHMCEFSDDLIKRGALNLDPTANDDKVITYHDSCNVARATRMGSSPGGQFVIPRRLIKSVSNKFVDMAYETRGPRTFCCGGGGGLLTDELMDIRIKGALPRIEALRDVMDDQGVTHMATICAICKSQFTAVLPHYDMDMEMIISLHHLVGDAIQLGTKD